MIKFFHDDVGFSWGFAIVGLTFVTRLVILPLSLKQIRSMRHLQQHAPELKALQEKYKGDKERLQREMMAFYRENKINPLASCWPLLLQLPVFLALYQLLNSDAFTEDVLAAPPVGFFFIDNLTEKAGGVELVVLIVLFIATQLGAGLVMSSRIQDRNQKIIMYALPVVFAPFIATHAGRARGVLDLDQRLDARSAVGRAHLLASSRSAYAGGDRGSQARHRLRRASERSASELGVDARASRSPGSARCSKRSSMRSTSRRR